MWEKMTGIKQNILRRWDSAPYPVKVCCIKFVQRVVHVQTVGSISDPRVCVQAARICVLLLTNISDRIKMKHLYLLFPEIMRFYRCPTLKQNHLVY